MNYVWIKDDWLPENLRAAKPGFCALFEQLRAGETQMELDRPQVETLREACRWVADELGPEELDTVASVMMRDVDELDAALKQFAQ